jgi:eukaryotic-like serine/threonine-protein kinase
MARRLLILSLFFISCYVTPAAGEGTGILNPKVKWKFKTQGAIRSTPTVNGQVVYFGSGDGFLYALNKGDGSELWKFPTSGSITSAAAMANSLAIISSNDNWVYAVNTANGQLVWKYQMQPLLSAYWEWEYFSATPVVANNKVYVGSGDGNLYVLSLQGKLLWKFKTNGRIRASSLITGGKIYLPSNDGHIYVLDENDGKLLWKFQTDGATLDARKFGYDRTCIFASPLLKDSLLVVASRDGKVYGVNVFTQKEKWRFTYGSTWAMSTSLEGDVVFVGWSTNNLVCALDLKTGKEKWKYKSGSVNYTKPLVVGSEVIFGSGDEKLYCLDKNSGQKKWEYKTKGQVFSSAQFDFNTIFFGSDDGYLYALEEGTKPIKAVYFPVAGNKYYSNFVVEPAITPYLKEKGFQQLDSATLLKFLNDRIRDSASSVVVFAFDFIPTTMVGENPSQGLIRKYLDAGGKIIWFGNTPNLYSFDAKGTPKMDESVASRMLDVNFVRVEESGNYHSKSTQTGLNWGLPSWLTITYATVDEKTVTPLAYDEFNRVSAWLKKFNSRPGSGFVSCRTWAWDTKIRDSDLDLIYQLAMHELE